MFLINILIVITIANAVPIAIDNMPTNATSFNHSFLVADNVLSTTIVNQWSNQTLTIVDNNSSVFEIINEEIPSFTTTITGNTTSISLLSSTLATSTDQIINNTNTDIESTRTNCIITTITDSLSITTSTPAVDETNSSHNTTSLNIIESSILNTTAEIINSTFDNQASSTPVINSTSPTSISSITSTDAHSMDNNTAVITDKPMNSTKLIATPETDFNVYEAHGDYNNIQSAASLQLIRNLTELVSLFLF